MELEAWLHRVQLRFERAPAVAASAFREEGHRLVEILAAHSPRRSGRLQRSWRWRQRGEARGEVLGASYARHLDRGGTVRSGRRVLGLLIPVGSRTRGSLLARRGGLITVPMNGRRGLKAIIIGRKDRKLYGVRKLSVTNRARPYLRKAQDIWRAGMVARVRRAIRAAVAKGG